MPEISYYETHHKDKGFKAPSEEDLLEMIETGVERSAISKEGAYILLHLVRHLTRMDDTLTEQSDRVVEDLYNSHYGWDNVMDKEAEHALAVMEDDGHISKSRLSSGSMTCAA